MSGRRAVSLREFGFGAIAAVVVVMGVATARAQTATLAPARVEEARGLLARLDAEALARLTSALADDQPEGARIATAAALAESPPVPAELCAALADAVLRAKPEDLAAVLGAARNTGDRVVVGAVIELLRRESPTVRASAMVTLRAMTGEAVTTDDPAGWFEWWNRSRSVTDGAWWRMIATNRGAMNRAMTARLGSAEQRLRRLFLEAQGRLTEEQRSAFVSELLSSSDARDQAMGLEFAERAILNARTLGASEVKGAATILQSPNVELRARAAALLDRMDPPGLGPEIRGALRSETSAEAASALLRLVGRRGWCDAEQDVLRWIRKGPGPAYGAALDAGAALLGNGCFRLDEDRDELTRHALAQVIGPAGLTSASPAVARICAASGNMWALRQLLASPIDEVARIAAESLAVDAESVDLIVSAASTRPALFGAAGVTLARHRPSVDGLAQLVSLPADESVRGSVVGAMARAMSPMEVVEGLSVLPSADLRVTAIESALTGMDPEEVGGAAWIRLRESLADALIESNRPEAALAALTVEGMPEAATASRRAMVLVWLGRLDEALNVPGSTVDDWMRGFERSYESQHAAETVRLMESVFAKTITPAIRARIDGLLAQREQDSRPQPE